MAEPMIDVEQAHRHFAKSCFNETWELLERDDRSESDNEEMIHTAHASRWHWLKSGDATPENHAVRDWQLARVYAVAGRAVPASRYAAESLVWCEQHDLDPFYTAYAYEALARAAAVGERWDDRDHYVRLAEEMTARVDDRDSGQMVLDDLASIPAR